MLNEPNRATGESAGVIGVVEQNRVHTDDTDTAVVLAALAELNVEAEATEQTALLKAQWWVLTLHWIGEDLPYIW